MKPTALASLVLLLAPLAACSRPAALQQPPALPVQIVIAREPVQADFADGPKLLGGIKGDVETTLSFRTGGLIDWVGADNDGRGWREGTFVKGGTVLARLNATEFESAVQSATSAVERERFNYERIKKLVSEKVASPQDFDKAKASWESAEADLRKTRQALADSTILAPQDGFIIARAMERGEMAAAGTTVLRFGDFRRMSLTLAVPDRWIGLFREGREIVFSVSAYEGRPFTGRVSEVGVAARATDRLFKVELKVENADGALRSGMTASVPVMGPEALPTGPKTPLLVPLAALTTRAVAGRSEAQLIVFVVNEEGKATERTVETGEIIGSRILVTGGELRRGDRIIISASDELHPGASVEPRAEGIASTRSALVRR